MNKTKIIQIQIKPSHRATTVVTSYRLETGNGYARIFAMYGHNKILLTGGRDVAAIKAKAKALAERSGLKLTKGTFDRRGC